MKTSPPGFNPPPTTQYHNAMCNNLFLKSLTHPSATQSEKLNRVPPILPLSKPAMGSWFENGLRYMQRNMSYYDGRNSPNVANGYKLLDKEATSWWAMHGQTA